MTFYINKFIYQQSTNAHNTYNKLSLAALFSLNHKYGVD